VRYYTNDIDDCLSDNVIDPNKLKKPNHHRDTDQMAIYSKYH
jgi:hypothetical protein